MKSIILESLQMFYLKIPEYIIVHKLTHCYKSNVHVDFSTQGAQQVAEHGANH